MAQYIINFAYISGYFITLSDDNLPPNGDNVEKSAEPVDNPVNEVGMVEDQQFMEVSNSKSNYVLHKTRGRK
jgi:hypothetical protein